MDFGGGPIALLGTYGVDRASGRYHRDQFAGIIGADILSRYKAVINCRTRTIFFKVDKTRHMQLARFALSQHFTRIPLREEISRNYTVPATLGNRPMRLMIDTGAPLTELDLGLVKSQGVPLKATRVEGSFINSAPRTISLGDISNLRIGNFQMAPQKLAVSALPDFATEGGKMQIAGLLGIDSLVFNRAIIDFDSMSLFLK